MGGLDWIGLDGIGWDWIEWDGIGYCWHLHLPPSRNAIHPDEGGRKKEVHDKPLKFRVQTELNRLLRVGVEVWRKSKRQRPRKRDSNSNSTQGKERKPQEVQERKERKQPEIRHGA